MATNSLHSLHHRLTNLLHHPSSSSSDPIPLFSSTFLKPTSPATSSSSISLSTTTSASAGGAAFSISTSTPPSTTTTTPQNTFTLDLLRHHLTAQDFRQADEETRRLLIVLAGEAAVTRGYVFFSEVQFISADELKAIDELWKEHSGGKFGYSVQKKIWVNKFCKRDFTKFFIRVGWMKKLESSEVEQYNYRAFPGEFIWELGDDTPEGHLPLTNALRGTQLLNCVLNHPAFEDGAQGDDDGEDDLMGRSGGLLMGLKKVASSSSSSTTGTAANGSGADDSSKKVFKTDYSF
ncbi:Tetrapyrrole-binding protein, chloroplastic [Linum grandiflorum]